VSESITNVEDAVAELGALPVPVGPEPQALSAVRLDEISARAAAATAGPWCTDSWEIYQGVVYEPGFSLWVGETCRGTTSPEQDCADAEFVAAARSDVPELVAEVVRLHTQVAALLAERHETNKALDDAVQALRVDRAAMVCRECNAPVMWVEGANDSWWNHTQPAEDGHSIVPRPLLRTSAAASADKLTALLAPSQALREDAAAAPCCHLHKPSCCDPEDCGPCCMACPTCPVLVRQRAEGSCTGCVVDHAPGECGYRPEAGAR
jgi:hypothetical protein